MTLFVNDGTGKMTNPTPIGGGFGTIEIVDANGDGNGDVATA